MKKKQKKIKRTCLAARSFCIGAGVSAILLTHLFLSSGCDRASRHKVLTFFFEGVPPLDGEAVGTDPNTLNTDGQAGAEPKTTMSAHEPRKDCYTVCHAPIKARIISRKVPLLTPVPDLCYKCHPDKSAVGRFAHGPAAVGDCTFCHNPHASKYPYLLIYPVPDMCYKCHDKKVIVSIEKHPREHLEECLACHVNHGSNRKLLRRSGAAINTDDKTGENSNRDISDEAGDGVIK